MTNPLIVVESPTKIRTIKKYLGKKYNVTATVGHIKDLPSKKIGVNIEDGFKPIYITIPGKQKILNKLKQAAKNSTDIYLAPDPDREGEAIAWHTAELLKKKGRKFHRVMFHELTKKAIIEAISNPKDLNKNKYEAQQTRRILDRLVGYEISPLLWDKVKRGLSAGRVQSVSVRIICEREKKIHAFETTEYWSIIATFKDNSSSIFDAKLILKNNKKLNIPNEKTSILIKQEILQKKFVVKKILKKKKHQNPKPPLTTSKLQQEAIKTFRFSAKRTMIIAQQLYEGIDIGPGEPTGLITYMRTDSTRVSEEAALEALNFIDKYFGKKYANKKPRIFKNKKKVQDAHEAIRPTSSLNTPEKMKIYLSKEQLKIYTLIWQKFIASQMSQAITSQDKIIIKSDDNLFNFDFTISSIKFHGFKILYEPLENNNIIQEKQKLELQENQKIELKKIKMKQHFTQPPSKFSEASLIKELEENGIGRPSTYTTILSNIRNKGYVELVNKYFKPTELGLIVNNLLTKNFPEIIDVAFTAKMEDELDKIEQKEMDAKNVLSSFYKKFSEKLEFAKNKMSSVKRTGISTDLLCPKCKKELRIKVGKNGHFIACSKYPKCTYSNNYERDDKGNIILVKPFKAKTTDEKCKTCGNPMVIKLGRYGKFITCTAYPVCKNTRSMNFLETKNKTILNCPQTECDGKIVEKSSKRGKIFYGCNRFPKCNFASWYKPTNKNCPYCKSNYLIEKTNKQNQVITSCPSSSCNYIENNHLD